MDTEAVTGQSHQSGEIVVGVDGSDANRPAVQWSVDEARTRGCVLLAVHAWHMPAMAYSAPGYLPISSDWMAEEATRLVEASLSGLPGSDGPQIERRVVEGSAYDTLEDFARQTDVSLVVVGSRGHGAVASLFLGSVSHSLSHHCPKPLVIVPHGWPAVGGRQVQHVVVGIDGSESADGALRWAMEEARLHGAALEVVTAWNWSSPPGQPGTSGSRDPEALARDLLDASIDRLDRHGIDVRATAREGVASDVLIGAARSADLLVVGTRGLTRTKEVLLGSTSHYCTHHSPVPLAVIPALGID